ncbi:Aste57867_24169 [Aphanomyces stellatus]|uniref:Aste57867_24169 protein n=1 Tax=Aphanomyces stellatus TaxID=120398 RepID=A0A485LQG4_9STRA|nr:hypothetical protein As57867_024095 [Aphanomyces stellatus]VFU00811.1 Aste57867_24169 [Aphanomyces stellatus]
MEFASTWPTADPVSLVQETNEREEHVFLSHAAKFSKSLDEDGACSITISFPDALKLLDIDIESSARHVEVYIVTMSAKGERQDTYVDTVRGARAQDYVYRVGYAFSNSRDAAVHAAWGVSFKFVSLQGAKTELTVRDLKLRVHPSATASRPSSGGASTDATMNAPMMSMETMQMILSMQQAMQKQMEEKIYQAVDARLTQLATRLHSTELMIQTLATAVPKAEVKHDKDAFAAILNRIGSLEKEVRAMKSVNESGALATSLQQLAAAEAAETASTSSSKDEADPEPTVSSTSSLR